MTHQLEIFVEGGLWDADTLPADLPNGVYIKVVRLSGGDQQGGLWGPEIKFILEFGSGVASSLIASWLYSKFCARKPDDFRINRRVVTKVEKTEITTIIEEEIKTLGK